MTAIICEAAPTLVESVTADLVDALTQLGNDIGNAIGDVLPAAFVVFGVIAAVTIGIGVFRMVTGAKKAPRA